MGIDSLFDGSLAFWDLTRSWRREDHGEIMRRLREPTVPADTIANYLGVLAQLAGRARGRWTGVRRTASREEIEAVELWLERGDPGRARVHLETGVRAALRCFDLEKAIAFKARWQKGGGKLAKKHKKAPTLATQLASLCGCTECSTAWERLASGALQAEAASRSARGQALTDEELDLQLWIQGFGQLRRRVCTREETTFVLTSTDDGPRIVCASGGRIHEPPYACTAWPENDRAYVSAPLSERAIRREGKHNYTLAQRHGTNVLWMHGTYQPTRDESVPDGVAWFSPPDEATAHGLVTAIAGPPPRAAKLGTVLRQFDNQKTLGVRDHSLVGWAVLEAKLVPLASFASPAEAEAAYDAQELDYLRSGDVIDGLRFID